MEEPAPKTRAARAGLDLDALSEEALLEQRLCDLPLHLKGSWVDERIQQLYAELDARGLRLKPPCYIGDEWFTPDGSIAIAVPFYLLHPRLLALEKKVMREAEGEAPADCLRLLRHECGHALAHAFGLTRRGAWIARFGDPRAEARDFYHFRPHSRSFVRHLKGWYAQSHPEEDFAETFAVWLDPHSDWAKRYAGWPALKKLEYVDQLMGGLKGQAPKHKRVERDWRLSTLKRKLSTHYAQRRKFYAEEDEAYYDDDLRRLFPAAQGQSAAQWIRRKGRLLDGAVSTWTREPQLTIGRLRNRLGRRCSKLGLRVGAGDEATHLSFAAYLATLITNYVFTSHFKRRP
jgi:hypothetical protein